MVLLGYSSLLLASKFLIILITQTEKCQGQFGGVATVDTNSDTSNIPVMVFQEGGYSSASSWASYNGTIEKDLISYSVCHRYKYFYDRPRMYLFTYAFDDKNANELFSEYHLGRRAFRICKRNTRFCAWHYEMPDLFVYRYACITYDGFKDLFKLYIDGVKVTSGPFSGDDPIAVVRSGGVTYLGQDQDSLGGGFNPRQSWSGEITQFNVWDFPLEEWMVENAAECRSDILGNVIKWQADLWIPNEIKVDTAPLFQLCGGSEDQKEQYFLFPNVFDFWFYKSWCYNMGGSVAVADTDEMYHSQMDIAESLVDPQTHEKCMHASGALMIWAGITDQYEEDMWVNPYTMEQTAMTFWEPGRPSGGTVNNCARTYIDRRMQDKSCFEANCALCYFPVRMNLSIRGLCSSDTKVSEGYFDLFYFIQGFISDNPRWRGHGKSHVYYRPRRQVWRLESLYDLERYAEFFADDSNPYDYFPTGRSIWKVNSGICQLKDNAEHKMSLTNCIYNDGSGYDFTCNDGTCVGMDKRCNLVDDCPDSSDEKDCDVLYFPRDYRSELFPITATGDPLSVTLNVSILAFPDISTLQMSFLCDYNLLMRWVDPRLQFYNLVDTFALNSLSASKQAQLWTPILSFPNARQAEGSLVDSGSNTVALKLGSPLEDDISRSVEAFIYEGVDSPLVMTREYLVVFNCVYDLRMYPFDAQICMIEFQVNGIPTRYLELGVEMPDDCPECDGGEYLGNRNLVEYLVGQTVMEDLTNYSEVFGRARVKIMFKRRWVYHLITVFFQSVLLLGVAYMTFYFKISNFQDRIMIAITTMMVVATIQSSINKMVPKTSYIKMIDVWLLYSFNIIIVMMVVHTYMDSYVKRDPGDQSTQPKAINPRKRVKNKDQIVDDDEEDGKSVKASRDPDKIDPWGENPDWDSHWVKAHKINYLGRIINLLVFGLFNIVFWGIALSHYYSDINILEIKPPTYG